MTKPTYSNKVTANDFPAAGAAFSSRFISNYAQKVQQDYAFFAGGLSLNDNMNGAVVSLSLAHGVPHLFASPLASKSRPIGAIAINCDTQAIPALTLSTTATVNGVVTTAPAGAVWVTATYPITNITDWVAFTPTGAWTTNATYTGRWRQVGDTMEAQVRAALTGAPNAANLTTVLPSGVAIDTTKLVGTTGSANVGSGSVRISASGAIYLVVTLYANSTTVQPCTLLNQATGVETQFISNVLPIPLGSGDVVIFWFRVPILGWSIVPAVSANVTIFFAGA